VNKTRTQQPSASRAARRQIKLARDDRRPSELSLKERLFTAVFSWSGIGYADVAREVRGDFKQLAFLDFGTLKLEFEKDCPAEFRALICAHAAELQARKGQPYGDVQSGQYVTLGHKLPAEMPPCKPDEKISPDGCASDPEI